jgi:hypothetical protein
VLVKHS